MTLLPGWYSYLALGSNLDEDLKQMWKIFWERNSRKTYYKNSVLSFIQAINRRNVKNFLLKVDNMWPEQLKTPARIILSNLNFKSWFSRNYTMLLDSGITYWLCHKKRKKFLPITCQIVSLNLFLAFPCHHKMNSSLPIVSIPITHNSLLLVFFFKWARAVKRNDSR